MKREGELTVKPIQMQCLLDEVVFQWRFGHSYNEGNLKTIDVEYLEI